MKYSIIFTTGFASLALARPMVYGRANNLQPFTGALAGIAATPVLDSGDAKRPFSVKGDTFVNLAAAIQRSCDQQFNACANSANGGNKAISVSDCSTQQTQCNAASTSASANTGNTAASAASSAKASATAAAVQSQVAACPADSNNAASSTSEAVATATVAAASETQAATQTQATQAASTATAAASTQGTGANLQTFTGALAGITATPVLNSGDAKRPFSVKGDTFVNLSAALQRSCDQQFNACANSANGGNKSISVSQCSDQQTQCNASAQGAQANTGNTGNAAASATSTAAAATATETQAAACPAA